MRQNSVNASLPSYFVILETKRWLWQAVGPGALLSPGRTLIVIGPAVDHHYVDGDYHYEGGDYHSEDGDHHYEDGDARDHFCDKSDH